MKPLALELQAFGPFAGRQEIDFRQLGGKTFFLIHGPTGAGKTSLLDGICFALFGDSSGGERDGRQMRSHHADAATPTEVRFSFALGDAVYRVRRVPEQTGPRRGGGETRKAPIAELCRLEIVDGVEVERPLGSGWTKVTEAVVGLLGFQSRQFRQVIVLPQGKFFEFLKSSSREREDILQTLFGTELYQRIEEALKEAAAEVAKRAESLRTQRRALLDQAGEDSEAALAERKATQQTALQTCGATETAAGLAAAATERLLGDARRVADRFDELDLATAALQSLQAEAPARWAERARLDAAHRAAGVEAQAAALADVDRRLAGAAAEAGLLATALAAAERSDAAAIATLAAERRRAPALEEAAGRIARLEALSDRVGALAEIRAAHDELAAGARAAAATHATAAKAQRQAVVALHALETEAQTVRLQAATIDGLKANATRLTTRLSQATALASRSAELVEATAAVDTAATRRLAAETMHRAVRTARDRTRIDWIGGQAARLARELVDGRPCPVCGSAGHPVPAHGDGPRVQDDTLAAAEDAVRHAEQALREAAEQHAAARTAAGSLAAGVAELRTVLGESAVSVDAQNVLGDPAAAVGDQTVFGDPAVPSGTQTVPGNAVAPVGERTFPGDAARPSGARTVPGTRVSIGGLQAEVRAARAGLTRAEAAATRLPTLDAALPAAQQTVRDAEAAALRAQSAKDSADGRWQQCIGQLAERQDGIAPELATPAALADACAAARAARDALVRTLEAATTAANLAVNRRIEARTRVDANTVHGATLGIERARCADEFAAQLAAAGFTNTAAFAAARLDARSVAALRRAVDSHAASLAAALDRHARAAGATTGLVRPDLDALGTRHLAARAAQRAAGDASRDALAALASTRAFAASLQRLADDHAGAEARFAVVRQVADVASGSNPQRMSFQRYVLATLLEEVLVATTQRLTRMSRGRYEMRRRPVPADQRAAAGLDLDVFDQHTGTTRSVATLSGGEAFLASLALALGLADVVQAYAGGIRLDAIFVDEGFGTLDAESLDIALRALQDLQQAGRMVGIISHVTELKEWIDARLEVTATQKGSVARFVV